MKDYGTDEVFLERILTESLNLNWQNIRSPRGHTDRRKRRVAVWAYSSFLGWEQGQLQARFGLQSRQAIQKILKKPILCEEEYNLRRNIANKWKSSKSIPKSE